MLTPMTSATRRNVLRTSKQQRLKQQQQRLESGIRQGLSGRRLRRFVQFG